MIIAGKYEVTGELGQGGMGVVYQVRHLELGSIFALKMLRPELIEAENATGILGRFYNEARVMARLRHRHVIQVFDIDQDQGRPYFVMEFIHGRSLHEILHQEGSLLLPRALAISDQIGQALAYAHAQQPPVIHRDIKPHNILLENGTGRVVVLDFGIAKLLDQQQTHYTRTGDFVGTLVYSSPEQLRGDATLDGRADLFSLGLVIYEMVAGRRFFADLSKEAIIGKQLYERGDYKPMFERPVPKAFRRLVAKAIAKDRDRRYGSVAELLDALAKVPLTRWAEWAWIVPTGGILLAALAALAWVWESPWRGEITRFVERRLASTFPAPPLPPPLHPSPAGEGSPKPGGPAPSGEPAKAAATPPPPAPQPVAPTPAVVAVKPSEMRAPDRPAQPVAPTTIRPPQLTHWSWTPESTALTLAAGQGQDFAVTVVEDEPVSSFTYRWWVDDRLEAATGPIWHYQPGAGAAGQTHTIRVEALDGEGGTVPHQWTVAVAASNRTPVAAVKAPKSAPPLPVTPPAGRIALKACETQAFAVSDDAPRRYAWWIDGQRQAEDGRQLRFAGQTAGQHAVRVAASGDEATGASWEVWVTPAPPSETEVRQWLEAYQRALEAQDFGKLRELGYLRSDSRAEALREKFRARPQNQVRIQDWQAEAQGNEVRLSFQQADRWRDPATRSLVVDYSSQSVTLVRPDCGRIVAR